MNSWLLGAGMFADVLILSVSMMALTNLKRKLVTKPVSEPGAFMADNLWQMLFIEVSAVCGVSGLVMMWFGNWVDEMAMLFMLAAAYCFWKLYARVLNFVGYVFTLLHLWSLFMFLWHRAEEFAVMAGILLFTDVYISLVTGALRQWVERFCRQMKRN